jgi:hypothetical protein
MRLWADHYGFGHSVVQADAVIGIRQMMSRGLEGQFLPLKVVADTKDQAGTAKDAKAISFGGR